MSVVKELERLVVRLVGDGTNYTKVLDKAVKDTTSAAQKIDKTTKEAMGTNNKAMKEAAAVTGAAAAPTKKYTKDLEKMKTAHANTGAAAGAHMGIMGKFGQVLSTGVSKLTSYASALHSTGKAMGILGTIMAVSLTLPILGAATALVKLAADAETTKNQFAVMLGADQGASMLASIKKMGAETPFEFPELAASAKVLVGFGVETKKVLPTLKEMGDVAAGTGTDIKQLATVFGQIQGMGRLQGQDFMQLVNSMFPVGELAKTVGLSMSDFKQAMEDGRISSDVVAETFRRVTAEGGQYYNMMQVLSETATGKFSNLVDAVKELAVMMGEYLLPTVKNVLDKIIAGVGWFKGLGENVHKVVMVVTGFVGILGPLLILIGGLAVTLGVMGTTLGAIIGLVAGVIVQIALWSAGIVLAIKAVQLLIDYIWGEGSFVSAIKSALMVAWDFTQKVVGFVAHIQENFQVFVGWVQTQFMALFAGVGEAWGAEIDAAIALTDEWRRRFVNFFDTAWEAAKGFAGKVVGFIANIGENFRLILDWLDRNWKNVLKDMGELWLSSFESMLVNTVVLLDTLFRLWTFFRGYMRGVFEEIFTVDFLKWIYAGLSKALGVWFDFHKSVSESLKTLFTGGDGSGLVDMASDFGRRAAEDFKAGMEGDILGGAGKIVGEQMGKMKSPLEGFESSVEALPKFNTSLENLPKFATSLDKTMEKPEKEAKKAEQKVKVMALEDKKKKEKEEKDPKETPFGAFKTMSLKQFSVDPIINTYRAPKKKQEVSDEGVQNKLDQVISAVKGQSPVAVMGR